MEISFVDRQLNKVFNSYELLAASYGPNVANSISSRMCVLKAVDRLGAVPKRPPVNLAPAGGGFTVNLADAKLLHFQASSAGGAAIPSNPDDISEIEILRVA